MVIRRTALGKPFDMSALVTKNDKTRAVGNMKVNARGDTIDSNGRIIQPVTSKVNKNYSKTVGNRTANPVRAVADKIQPEPIQEQIVLAELPKEEELTQEEIELIAEMEDDFEVEEIKKASNKEEE
jgi:hypothetical protein